MTAIEESSHVHYLKAPKVIRSKGRARPDEPLAAWCEVHRADICSGRATVRHHRFMRSHGGSDQYENTLDICEPCHRLIHARPTLSYAHGWLLRAEP